MLVMIMGINEAPLLFSIVMLQPVQNLLLASVLNHNGRFLMLLLVKNLSRFLKKLYA